MNKYLCVSALCGAFFLTAAASFAAEEKDSAASIVKASYALPKSAGEEIRKNMREAEEEDRAAIKRQMEKAHAELYALLAAPDFDRKAFLEKAKEIRTLQEEIAENQDDALGAAAVQLSPEDRRTFVNALEGKAGSHAQKHASKDEGDRFETPASELSPSAGGK